MTKKYVIHNLVAGGWFFKRFDKRGKAIFLSDALEAMQFDEKGAAEMVLAALLPTQIQKNEDNKFWEEGFLFTILEVYV
jgi:hypothetical protein